MNNLKRVLSLALSGILLIGTMTVGASAADFVDADEIVHDDAVNILVALNVINGKDDGSHFDPTGDVTRAEMAKMIAVAMNGGKDTNTGVKGTPTFTDIKGHWAESYIEYCADMGIISGRGDGTFDPGANVTGLEATKMVLTALGYDSTAYKLTGPSWAVRTDELAKTAEPNIYEELGDVVMAKPASRDTAAQIIWNGLQNWTKRVTPQQNTSTGETTWVYGDGKGTLLKERYDADIVYGIYVGNYNTGAASGIMKGEIAVKETYSQTSNGTTTTRTRTHSVPSDLGIENIGEEVKVIYKDAKNSKSGPDRQDTIYGVFNTGKTEIITATRNDVKKAADQPDAADKFKVGDTEYTLATPSSGDILVEKNYASSSRVPASGANAAALLASAKNAFVALRQEQNGDTIKFVCDNDGKIAAAYVVETKIAAVTAVNSAKITLNNGVGTVTIANGDVEEGLKKGDVVTATVLYKDAANKDDAYVIVKKAESVTGEVNGYKLAENVTVDGKAYKILEKSPLLSPIPDEDDVITSFNTGDNTYIGEDVTLYLVNGYVGAAVQNSEAANNYSLVTEVKGSSTSGSTFDALQLQVMSGEGTKSIITVSKDSKDVRHSTGDGITAALGSDLPSTLPSGYKKVIDNDDYQVGDISTYTINKDNEAEVTVEGKVDYTTNAKYSSDDTKFNNTVTAADCVVFVQTEAKGDMSAANKLLFAGATYKVFKIRDLKGFNNTGAAATKNGVTTVTNRDGKVIAAFANIAGGKDPSGATTNTVYGIVSAAKGRVMDYFAHEVQSNGETYIVNSKDELSKGSLVFFDKTNDDNYASGDVKVVNTLYHNGGMYAGGVYTKELDGKKALTFYKGLTGSNGDFVGAGQTTYQLDSDVKIIYVDQDNDTSDGESALGAFDSVTGHMNGLIVYENTSNDVNTSTWSILAIYVEVSNECNIVNNTAKTLYGTSLSAAAVKGMGDGVFRPAVGTTFSKNATTGLPGSYADEDLVLVNFTTPTGATGAGTATVTFKKGSDVVHSESTSVVANTVYCCYVDTAAYGMSAAGTYSYTVTVGSTQIASGSFTK